MSFLLKMKKSLLTLHPKYIDNGIFIQDISKLYKKRINNKKSPLYSKEKIDVYALCNVSGNYLPKKVFPVNYLESKPKQNVNTVSSFSSTSLNTVKNSNSLPSINQSNKKQVKEIVINSELLTPIKTEYKTKIDLFLSDLTKNNEHKKNGIINSIKEKKKKELHLRTFSDDVNNYLQHKKNKQINHQKLFSLIEEAHALFEKDNMDHSGFKITNTMFKEILESIYRIISFYDYKNEFLYDKKVINLIQKEIFAIFEKNKIKNSKKTKNFSHTTRNYSSSINNNKEFVLHSKLKLAIESRAIKRNKEEEENSKEHNIFSHLFGEIKHRMKTIIVLKSRPKSHLNFHMNQEYENIMRKSEYFKITRKNSFDFPLLSKRKNNKAQDSINSKSKRNEREEKEKAFPENKKRAKIYKFTPMSKTSNNNILSDKDKSKAKSLLINSLESLGLQSDRKKMKDAMDTIFTSSLRSDDRGGKINAITSPSKISNLQHIYQNYEDKNSNKINKNINTHISSDRNLKNQTKLSILESKNKEKSSRETKTDNTNIKTEENNIAQVTLDSNNNQKNIKSKETEETDSDYQSHLEDIINSRRENKDGRSFENISKTTSTKKIVKRNSESPQKMSSSKKKYGFKVSPKAANKITGKKQKKKIIKLQNPQVNEEEIGNSSFKEDNQPGSSPSRKNSINSNQQILSKQYNNNEEINQNAQIQSSILNLENNASSRTTQRKISKSINLDINNISLSPSGNQESLLSKKNELFRRTSEIKKQQLKRNRGSVQIINHPHLSFPEFQKKSSVIVVEKVDDENEKEKEIYSYIKKDNANRNSLIKEENSDSSSKDNLVQLINNKSTNGSKRFIKRRFINNKKGQFFINSNFQNNKDELLAKEKKDRISSRLNSIKDIKNKFEFIDPAKKKLALIMNINQDLNYYLNQQDISEKEKKMYLEFKEKVEAFQNNVLGKFQSGYIDDDSDFEQDFESLKEELENIKKIRLKEKRINHFLMNLSDFRYKNQKLHTFYSQKVKVKDSKFLTTTSSLLTGENHQTNTDISNI